MTKKSGKQQAASAAAETTEVQRIIRKTVANESLTAAERSTLKNHEKAKEETLRWEYYRTIPLRHWREMSGRQAKILYEQAQTHGIPFGERVIDLPKVARALHDFLAKNKWKLAQTDDPLMNGNTSPALERYREERAQLARLDRLERERQLLPRDAVREALGRIASIIRSAGDTLQRCFGTEAVEILYGALSDSHREVDRMFGPGDDSESEYSE